MFGNDSLFVLIVVAKRNDNGSHWDKVDIKWGIVQRWNGPERIRYFLWLYTHRTLLMNRERYRKHMAVNPRCDKCGALEESLVHVPRDCRHSEDV